MPLPALSLFCFIISLLMRKVASALCNGPNMQFQNGVCYGVAKGPWMQAQEVCNSNLKMSFSSLNKGRNVDHLYNLSVRDVGVNSLLWLASRNHKKDPRYQWTGSTIEVTGLDWLPDHPVPGLYCLAFDFEAKKFASFNCDLTYQILCEFLECPESCDGIGVCNMDAKACSTCESGTYGHNCAHTCPESCGFDRSCDYVTGECGYDCIFGKYGDLCEKDCPLFCVYCDRYNGTCSEYDFSLAVLVTTEENVDVNISTSSFQATVKNNETIQGSLCKGPNKQFINGVCYGVAEGPWMKAEEICNSSLKMSFSSLNQGENVDHLYNLSEQVVGVNSILWLSSRNQREDSRYHWIGSTSEVTGLDWLPDHPVPGFYCLAFDFVAKRIASLNCEFSNKILCDFLDCPNSCAGIGVCNIETSGCSSCEPGTYGHNCEETCPKWCGDDKICHNVTGECVHGCAIGRYGPLCELDCSLYCDACDRHDGSCHVNKSSDAMNFTTEENVNVNKSTSIFQTTNTINETESSGALIFTTVEKANVTKSTSSFQTTKTINETDSSLAVVVTTVHSVNVNKSTSSFQTTTTIIQTKPCKENCKCPAGYHGDRCQLECSDTCNMTLCDQYTSRCTHGCETGWTGASCNEACFHCEGDGSCTQDDHICYSDCYDSVHGNKCIARSVEGQADDSVLFAVSLSLFGAGAAMIVGLLLRIRCIRRRQLTEDECAHPTPPYSEISGDVSIDLE